MNESKLFDVLCHMQDNPEENFTGFKKPLTPKQQPVFVMKAIQAFVHNATMGTEKRHIQAFSGSTDLPKLTKDVFNVTNEIPNFDLGWQKAYKGIKLKKGQLEWEVATVRNGFVFKLVPEGAKVTFSGVSGEKITVGIEKYGEGLGLTWELVEGRKLYQFIDSISSMRAALYTLWANIHYGLLATAAATNQVAWVAGTNDLDRDVKTLNATASLITSATKDSGYGDTAQAKLILYISPLLRARIDAALKATRTELIAGGVKQAAPVSWPIEVVYTYTSQITVNTGVMVLPGHKIQNAAYIRELMMKRTNIETLSEESTFWTMFGAIVADADQTAEPSFI